MSVFIEPDALESMLSVKKFKQHSMSLKSLLDKVESDLHKRYTPFDQQHFLRFINDINEGMSLISIVGEQLMFDLKYSNLQFLVEPFKRVNIFASNILNVILTAFESSYREYLRVTDELEKASQTWLPLQFLLKEGIRIQGVSNIKSINLALEKSKQQDDRDIQEMNDAIQDKKLYLKYLTPVTKTQLFKLEEEIQKISEISKSVIDQAFKGMSSAQESITKAWTQQFIKKWKQSYMSRLKEIIMGMEKMRVENQKAQRLKKQNIKHQETQTQEKQSKGIPKKILIDKLQKQLEMKNKLIIQLETQITVLKNSNQFNENKKMQEDRKKQEFIIRQFAIKNQQLEAELDEVKTEYAAKTQLISRRMEVTQDKLGYLQLELEKTLNDYEKQSTRVKGMEKTIHTLKKEIQQLNNEKLIRNTTKVQKTEEKQEMTQYPRIQSFKSLGGASMKSLSIRISKEMRSMKLASREKETQNKRPDEILLTVETMTKHQKIVPQKRQNKQKVHQKVTINQVKLKDKDQQVVQQIKDSKQESESELQSQPETQLHLQLKSQKCHQNYQIIQESDPINQQPTVRINITANQSQRSETPSSQRNLEKQNISTKNNQKQQKSSKREKQNLRLTQTSKNQIQFELKKDKQTPTKFHQRKGFLKEKGELHRGAFPKSKIQEIVENQNGLLTSHNSANKKTEIYLDQALKKKDSVVTDQKIEKNKQSTHKQLKQKIKNHSRVKILSQLPNIDQVVKQPQQTNFLECKPLLHQKSVETQTPFLANHTTSIHTQTNNSYENTQRYYSEIAQKNNSIRVPEQTDAKKKYFVQHPMQSSHRSRQQSFENTLDHTFNSSSLNSLGFLNRKPSSKKKKYQQLTQFSKIQFSNIAISNGLASNNRFSNKSSDKWNAKSFTMKQKFHKSLATRNFEPSTIHSNNLPSVNQQMSSVTVSKVQQVMLKYLKLLKVINRQEHDLFTKSLVRLNKYSIDLMQQSQTMLHRKLLNFFNNGKRCDNCFILRIFVQKMDVVWEWFNKFNTK